MEQYLTTVLLVILVVAMALTALCMLKMVKVIRILYETMIFFIDDMRSVTERTNKLMNDFGEHMKITDSVLKTQDDVIRKWVNTERDNQDKRK